MGVRTRLLAAAVPLVLGVGCGSASQPASGPEVVADAVAALEAAGSVRLQGTAEPAFVPNFDVHVQGEDAVGTVWLADQHDASFVVVDGQGYVLPHPDFYTEDLGAGEDEAARLRGRYLTMPDQDWRGQWPGSLDDVIEHFLPSADEVAAEAELSRLDGRPVRIVTGEDGRRLAVAAEAPHYPVRLQVPVDEDFAGAGAPDAVVTFSDFGVRRDVVPPADPIPPGWLGD